MWILQRVIVPTANFIAGWNKPTKVVSPREKFSNRSITSGENRIFVVKNAFFTAVSTTVLCVGGEEAENDVFQTQKCEFPSE